MGEVTEGYEVGYGKPPKASQFAQGRSGNPKGRPRGSKNLATLVLKESRQPVRINGPHGARTVSKLQAAIMQLGNKSAQGDLRASRDFLTLVQRSEESAAAGSRGEDVCEADQRTMQNLLRRMAAIQSNDKTPEEKEQ
jgi:Family of unknown function (DUF5681)